MGNIVTTVYQILAWRHNCGNFARYRPWFKLSKVLFRVL